MESRKIINSIQNPLVKNVLRLKEKSRERKKSGRFIIEGKRELELAFKGGYELENVLICEGIGPTLEIDTLFGNTINVSKPVYQKLAHRGSTEGILAIAKSKDHHLDKIRLGENPLVLVAESPEKPGNVGALLRTADAANLDAVFISNPKSDIYNPNIIRSSVGCVFTTQIGVGSSEEVIQYLKHQNITIFCATLAASKPYIEANFNSSTAIVVGTEATGLTEKWLEYSNQNIIIPMQGEIDSMNVSVSAAILIFEAKRQRGF